MSSEEIRTVLPTSMGHINVLLESLAAELGCEALHVALWFWERNV